MTLDECKSLFPGLDKLHSLTAGAPTRYEVRADLQTANESAYAVYDFFQVASSQERYKLTVGKYRGTAGESPGPGGGILLWEGERSSLTGSGDPAPSRGSGVNKVVKAIRDSHKTGMLHVDPPHRTPTLGCCARAEEPHSERPILCAHPPPTGALWGGFHPHTGLSTSGAVPTKTGNERADSNSRKCGSHPGDNMGASSSAAAVGDLHPRGAT